MQRFQVIGQERIIRKQDKFEWVQADRVKDS